MKRLFSMQMWSGPVALSLALAWLTFLAVAYAWPASYWIEVTSVRVLDSKQGEPILMMVDRRVNREFHGSWVAHVRVHRIDGDELVCPSAGESYYKRTSVLPEKLTLGWWTNGQCPYLPPGRYVVETTWTVNPSAWPFPPKRIYVTSNVFEISE